MDYLELILTFHQKYTKRWYVIDDVLFFRFLISSLVIVIAAVLYLANHNFNQGYIQHMIGERYKEYIIDIHNMYKNGYYSKIELYDIEADQVDIKPSEKAEISKEIATEAQGDILQNYNDLLLDGEDFETLSYDIENLAPPSRFFKQTSKRISGAFGSADGDQMDLANYKIYRNAALYLDTPEYLLEEKKQYIYRAQDDILKVIYSKSSFIESCYQKAARTKFVQPGFVKVEFQIAASGYVLPTSIKILDSTIRNKEVEQCIKKNIRRWRTFPKLKDTEGIAHVVHKFVFN